jgi:hypothetical protein
MGNLFKTPSRDSARFDITVPTHQHLPAVFFRTAKLLLVSALMLSLGAHWMLLQSVAWMGMMVNYSKDAPFLEAVSKTFDGRHPCRLCQVVHQGRADEKKQDQRQTKPVSKLDLGIVWESSTLVPDLSSEQIPFSDLTAPARSDAPPKPRPRHSSPGISA